MSLYNAQQNYCGVVTEKNVRRKRVDTNKRKIVGNKQLSYIRQEAKACLCEIRADVCGSHAC